MRRLICFVLYISMILVGIVLLAGFLINGGRGFIFMSGGFLAFFGCYLLWTDFLSPNTKPL
jgi:hypothetical protein